MFFTRKNTNFKSYYESKIIYPPHFLLLFLALMLFSCTKDNLHDNIVSMKYQAIAADEASNFFSSTSSKELFAKTKNNLDLKIDNASLIFEYIENTSLAMPVFKATTKYTKMSTEVFLVKVEDVILPFLFNRIADEKAQTKEFSGIIIISKLNGDFVNGYKVINGVFVSQFIKNTNNYTTEENINFVNSLRDNFPGLYDYYYARAHPDYNHNLMAQHYRSTIADIAQTFDNNTFPRQIYEDLAWAGLRVIDENTNSIAWNNLTTEEQERIKSNLLNIFHNGTKNCN